MYAFCNRNFGFVIKEFSDLNLEIEIGEASKNFVERIEVVNNTRTLDSVVRREMEIIEGDPFKLISTKIFQGTFDNPTADGTISNIQEVFLSSRFIIFLWVKFFLWFAFV